MFSTPQSGALQPPQSSPLLPVFLRPNIRGLRKA